MGRASVQIRVPMGKCKLQIHFLIIQSKDHESPFVQYSFSCRIGLSIGLRPWLTIILSVCLCFICTAGNVFWQVNTDDEALWTPYGSPVGNSCFFLKKRGHNSSSSLQFIKQRNWILSNFPKDTRYETVLISAKAQHGNVLTADTVQYVSIIDKNTAVSNCVLSATATTSCGGERHFGP